MTRFWRPLTFVALAATAVGGGATAFRLFRRAASARSDGAPPRTSSTESRALVRRGYHDVPSIYAARFLATRLPGPIAPISATCSVLLASAWPFLPNLLVRAFYPHAALNGTSTLPTCAILTATNALMLTAAWWGWRMFVHAIDEIDDLIGLVAEKVALRAWIARRLGRARQFAVCAVFVIVVTVVRELHSGRVPVPLMSHVIVGWSAAIGAGTLYWIITWAEGPVRLYRCESLKLQWYDSTRTPGVRVLQRIYSFIAITLGGGVFAAEGFSLLVADRYGSALPPAFWTFLPAVFAALALYAGAGPFYFLYMIIRREREAVLVRIGKQLDRYTPDQLDHPDAQRIMESYAHISSLSTWPLTSSAVAEYVAAMVGSLLAYALGRF